MLLKADEGHIVNTSSVNGFWASLGPAVPHTAYAAAKFAVKGFTEALITDLRLNAPHIKCSVVMPGHIGTSIVSNSRKVQTGGERLTADDLVQARQRMKAAGMDVARMSDEDIQNIAAERARAFREDAPMTAAAAAKVILDGVKAERWRILVGDDAHRPRRARPADAGTRLRTGFLRERRRRDRLAGKLSAMIVGSVRRSRNPPFSTLTFVTMADYGFANPPIS